MTPALDEDLRDAAQQAIETDAPALADGLAAIEAGKCRGGNR